MYMWPLTRLTDLNGLLQTRRQLQVSIIRGGPGATRRKVVRDVAGQVIVLARVRRKFVEANDSKGSDDCVRPASRSEPCDDAGRISGRRKVKWMKIERTLFWI